MNPTRTTAPAAPALSLSRVKAQLRVTSTDEDDLLADYIAVVTQQVEDELGLGLITQSWTWYLDRFPGDRSPLEDFWYQPLPISGERRNVWLELPRAPVTGITSVTYYDASNESTVWSSSKYELAAKRWPARLRPVEGEIWPQTYNRLEAVAIVFAVGYGADHTAIPAALRQAMMMAVGRLYEHREDVSNFHLFAVPGVESMLSQYRLRWAA